MRLFRQGIVAKGRVVDRLIRRGRGWLTYEYSHAGTMRRGRQFTHHPYEFEPGADCLVLFRPGPWEPSVILAPGVRLQRGRWRWAEDDGKTRFTALWQLAGYYASCLLLAVAGLIVVVQILTGC
jgi:hypothetical protein